MNNFLKAALHYAALGWRVFPLAPGQKIPITAHGCKDATTDAEQIRAWWTKTPNANIGMACGAGSGVYVIDVDVSASGDVNGIESLGEFPQLPLTIRQDTPRGGFHAFYRTSTPPANRNSFRPGIDVRGEGYYVVLAPSLHPNGGRYAWSPGCAPWEIPPAEYPNFMRPVTRAPWAASQIGPANPPTVAPHAPYSDDALRRASLYLAQCDPAIQGCGGHDRLLWAAGAMTHGCKLPEAQAYAILASEFNPRCSPPWNLDDPKDEKDFRRKVTESVKRPTDKPFGWILDDPAYAPPECMIDVRSLLAGTTGRQLLAVSDSTVTTTSSDTVPSSGELEYLTRPTGLLGEICSWINATAIKEQPFLALACALSFLGALFGRKIKDASGSRTNLYCMGIAPSSAGKAHAMNQIRRLCEASGCTDLLGGDDIASDSAIEDRISRVEATLFLWDEIGHLLAHIKSGVSKHHAQVVSLLMKLYSAAGNVYKGREYAEAEKQRTIIQPCCCIYGTSTPERFTGGISPAELQDGWLSRCLVFYSPNSPRKSRGRDESPVPEKITERVNAWYSRKIEPPTDGHSVSQFVTPSNSPQPPTQIVIPTAADAEKLFVAFDDETIEYGKGHPQLACLWAKGEENARRIALIVAAGEAFDNPVITLPIADYACRLVRALLMDFGTTIAPEIVSSKIEADKRRVISVIAAYGVAGCVKRDLNRDTRWFRDQRERQNLLSDLRESEDIISQESGKTTRYWTAKNFLKFTAKQQEAG